MQDLKLSFFLSIIFILGLVTISYHQNEIALGSLATTNLTKVSSNYTTYGDARLGVSFAYPSNWTLDEKINRFEKNSEVAVINGNSSFRVMKSQSNSDAELAEKLGGPREIIDLILPSKERIIGQVEDNKYVIDDADTASVLTVLEGMSNVPDRGLERIILIHDDTLFVLTYQDDVNTFDSRPSQEVFNHIINSFQFLDTAKQNASGGSDNGGGDDDDDGDRSSNTVSDDSDRGEGSNKERDNENNL
jgi:hypothetical protein